MEQNKNIHELLSNRMASEAADIETPGLLHVIAARNAVLARKKVAKEKTNFLSRILPFFNPDLKFYHLGISVLLITFSTIYITETHYSPTGSPGFSDHSYNNLSIKNSTISVNSSTMLTSIPTLRN
jgi:hypothetical protein